MISGKRIRAAWSHVFSSLALAALAPVHPARGEEPAAPPAASAVPAPALNAPEVNGALAPQAASSSAVSPAKLELTLDLSNEERLLRALQSDRDLHDRADRAISMRGGGKMLVLLGVATAAVSAVAFWVSVVEWEMSGLGCAPDQKCGHGGAAIGYSALGFVGGVSMTVGGGFLWRAGNRRIGEVASEWGARHGQAQ